MKRLRMIVPVVVLVMVAAACAGDDDTTEPAGSGTGTGATDFQPDTGNVNLLSAAEPEEAGAYQEIFDELINADASYHAEVESAGNFEEQFQIRAEGGTLDVAAVPQPGAIPGLVDAGSLVSLEDLGFDIDALSAMLGESFVELGEYNGAHYGIPTNINLKSMVWYPKAAFDDAGYTVPETWDDLIALSDQIVADGGTPWCVGFQSEGSTGWPATDWMEDIMLRTAGGDVYDQWYKHEIPFNDESVLNAINTFGDVMFADGYVLGGAEATPDVPFGDAPLPMFQDPPGCWLHRQASFINAFFPTDTVAGEDYDWFPLPPIDQEGTLYAGELTVVGTAGNRAEVVDFLNQFIDQEVQCAMGGVQASSRISPNVEVGPECYANAILADASVILTESLSSGTGRFDASDLMPAEVGSGSFWSGMVDYMKSGPDSAQTVLDDIEASWPAA
ncbi:MAG TPA: ABC transporter substrate-binding protein [Actinomycetota bacterium]|jgi:alpha-glucoside transport system substrate-binding protein